MPFDPLSYPYPSRRTVRYAKKGMVATSQPLAASAGIEILRAGGNAIDAAVATAACLTVVEPTSNGIGGDSFTLLWSENELKGLNASGSAPAELTIERVRAAGHETMPLIGPLTVTVPGAVSAWGALSKRFGRLPFGELLKPAISIARSGFAIAPTLGSGWAFAADTFSRTLEGAVYAPWFDTFAPGGRAPRIGELWRAPDHADTLERIATFGSRDFYEGDLALRIDDFARHAGIPLSGSDLAAYSPEWVTPLSTRYRDYEVWEMPPNGQGMISLMALNIFQRLDINPRDHLTRQHFLIEALKCAFIDGQAHIADPAKVPVPTDWLLSDDYAAARAAKLTERAAIPMHLIPRGSGTVYLATADGEGNMVSMIQSNYKGFGSGLVVPGTGIALHNRGREFSLDSSAPNALVPGKRPYHTIIPGFLTHQGRPVGPFGVMGGYMQPQGHVQVIANLLDLGENPQAALDAPRWLWSGGLDLSVEPHFPIDLAQGLARRGHAVHRALDATGFGRGQIIMRNEETGILAGGSDSRTDGEVQIM